MSDQQKANALSLWFEFAPEDANVLRRVINRLSEQFVTPSFEPHITLLGLPKIRREKASTVFAQATAFMVRASCFDVSLNSIGTEDSYFQRLFLRVTPNEIVEGYNIKAQNAFCHHSPYMPHASLLYGTLNAEQIKTAVSITLDLIRLPILLRVTVVSLWDCWETPSEWERLCARTLSTKIT